MTDHLKLHDPEAIAENPEGFLTRLEILEAIGLYAQNYSLKQELLNANGIYRLTVVSAGEKSEDTIEHIYQRRGYFESLGETHTTQLLVAYYDADGIPDGGRNLAAYNERTGQWKYIVQPPSSDPGKVEADTHTNAASLLKAHELG